MQTPRWIRALTCSLALTASFAVMSVDYFVYVGTYTGPKSEGIHAFKFNSETGKAEPMGLVAKARNPTFLAVHPAGSHLYVVNEISGFRGDKGGSVTAYRINRTTGALTELNQEATLGDGPCHLVVDPTGSQVLVANYGGGSVVTLPIREDGSLGPSSSFVQHKGSSVNPGRQREPHGHSINLSTNNRFAYAADLGTDYVYVYPFSPEKGLAPATGPDSLRMVPLPSSLRMVPGSGPRHVAIHLDGTIVYVINELLSTITVCEANPDTGALKAVQTVSTLPTGFTGSSTTAEIVIHPNHRVVYGSNRGHDSIAIFEAERGTGRLTAKGHAPTGGKTPRNFNLDPSGSSMWVGNQGSDEIVVFKVNQDTGELTPTGQKWTVGAPVCFKFVRAEAP